MIDQLIQQALDCWELIYPGVPQPIQLDCILQSRSQIIVFHFATDQRNNMPVLISKISRSEDMNPSLERSVNLLQQLRHKLSPRLLDTIPTAVIAGQVERLSHVVMNPVPGHLMLIPGIDRKTPHVVQLHINAFSSWLLDFQSQTSVGYHSWNKFAWEEYFKKWLGEDFLYEANEGKSSNWHDIICTNLSDVPIPLAWCYGDAHHSNLLLDNYRISGVVDWVGTRSEDFVFHDWYYFLFLYAVEFFKKNYGQEDDERAIQAIDTIMGVTENQLSKNFKQENIRFLQHHQLEPNLNSSLFISFLSKLYWPNNKQKLIQHAISNTL